MYKILTFSKMLYNNGNYVKILVTVKNITHMFHLNNIYYIIALKIQFQTMDAYLPKYNNVHRWSIKSNIFI